MTWLLVVLGALIAISLMWLWWVTRRFDAEQREFRTRERTGGRGRE